MMQLVSALGFAAVLSTAAMAAQEDGSVEITNCETRLDHVANPPSFAAFPATDRQAGSTVKLRLAAPEARRFRTVLRQGVAHGPNFAGHYAVVVWGCGAACSDMAIVDTKSGRVFFDPQARDIDGLYVGDEPDQRPIPYWAARFRLDSRLLVVVGAPNEDDDHDGVTYFEWTGSQLKLIRFVPRQEACVPVTVRFKPKHRKSEGPN